VTSAKPEAVPLEFGPVIERVIPDFESLEPPQVLQLLAGNLCEIPVALFKAGDQAAAREWATTNRMLAFINFGGDSRGFSCMGWKFGDLRRPLGTGRRPTALSLRWLRARACSNRSSLEGAGRDLRFPWTCIYR